MEEKYSIEIEGEKLGESERMQRFACFVWLIGLEKWLDAQNTLDESGQIRQNKERVGGPLALFVRQHGNAVLFIYFKFLK